MSDVVNGESPATEVVEQPKKAGRKVKRAFRKARNRDNPPYYLIVGVGKTDGARVIITELPTIGRSRKFVEQMGNFIRLNYSTVQIVRCKAVPAG